MYLLHGNADSRGDGVPELLRGGIQAAVLPNGDEVIVVKKHDDQFLTLLEVSRLHRVATEEFPTERSFLG